MSIKTPKTPALPESWQAKRRVEGGLRQVRRTKDNKLVFKGQDADEEVKLVVRQHPLFLLRPALPVLGVLLLFFINSALLVRFPSFSALWWLFDLLLAVLFFITLGYFIWRDFIIWWVEIDIITDKRIISCRNFIHPKRTIITLDKIVQVSTDQESLLSILLQYGGIHIYLTGGKHVLQNVPRPREIRDAVNGIYMEFKAKTVKPANLPPIADPDVSAVIATLGKKEVIPTLPNADQRYAPPNTNMALVRKPLRRFGGPLRIPAEITYAPDEQTVMYIQRSKWLLIARLSGPAVLLIADLVLTFIFTSFALITILAALVILIAMGLITINFVDDVFILTNKRVIDIERKFIFFYEARVEAEYKNIRDIKSKISNITENLLDIGSVYVETPGSNPDINMTVIDHPFFIADKINEIKSFKEKTDEKKAKNTRQDELINWFTNVTAVLEKKMTSRGVPNLQTMDLWSAAAMATEMGMKVIPVGEDDSYPQIPAGRIVSQNPLPGTLMEVDAASEDGRPRIEVVLSKHN